MSRIITIDCEYILPLTAAAFLVEDSGELAFVENNTNRAVPILLKTLADYGYEPEAVRYIIVTHIHLDHAGGTGELLKACPNAKVVAHPRAARHLIDPSRLIASAEAVYGKEEFEKMYGVLTPVPAEKILEQEDGARLDFGQSSFRFFHTRGHANHHFCVYYDARNVIFTGDTFGLAYPVLQYGTKPLLYATTSPTDYIFEEAIKSIDIVRSTGAVCAYLTHFGAWHDMDGGAAMLRESLEYSQKIFEEAVATENFDWQPGSPAAEALKKFYFERLDERGISHYMNSPWLQLDLQLNVQGLMFAASKYKNRDASHN